MFTIEIHFNKRESIKIENVIMQQVIGNDLIIIFKIESYDYNYTEVKHYPMNSIEYFIVR